MGQEQERLLDSFRELMRSHFDTPLHAYIIPSEDNHLSEYVADRDKRREYISGFTGSTGTAVVTEKDALLYVDGRYFLQASQQLSKSWRLMKLGEDPPYEKWLADNLPRNSTVAVDARCISVDTSRRLEHEFEKVGHKLLAQSTNLVDVLWLDRPPPTITPISVHPLEFTGRSTKEKLSNLRSKLLQEKAHALIITTLDEVAWLYNIRGGDVAYNPVAHAFAIVTSATASLYIDRNKVDENVAKYLKENEVDVRDYDAILSDVEALSQHCERLAQNVSASNGAESEEAGANGASSYSPVEPHLIWVDSATCNYAIFSRLPAAVVHQQQSPLQLAKALKHEVELNGLRECHIRDGVALVSFLAWLDEQMQRIHGVGGYFEDTKDGLKRKFCEEKLTEVSVAAKLEAFRQQQRHFKGLSFPTISSSGSNAAVIHYQPEEATCLELDANKIYLCDSGAQYLDGTTDVTRTVHFAQPTQEERTAATQVLRGYIALARAIFPNGTTGHVLDILARVPLWTEGLDYRHGTGHGVGSYLNVHEGPHLISFRPTARNVPLQANMTVTIEPGYYEDGSFGTRVENVMIVKEAQRPHNFGGKGYLEFEAITLAPLQVKLMDTSIMTKEDKEYVDSYHALVREKLTPHLSGQVLEWLHRATEPLRQS